MQYYLGVAKKEGISDEEIGAAQAIVMAVAGGRINAQFREAQLQGKIRASEEKQGTCGSQTCGSQKC
jgi:hypothetical protein